MVHLAKITTMDNKVVHWRFFAGSKLDTNNWQGAAAKSVFLDEAITDNTARNLTWCFA